MCSRLQIALLISVAGFFIIWPSSIFAAFNIDSVYPSIVASQDDVITLSVSATGLSDKPQYLQAAMTKEGKANYFGFTYNGTEWKKYESAPQDHDSLFSFTPVDGAWSGSVQVKVDTSDSGFTGPGSYIVKLLKYISSSSGVSSNNTASISINFNSSATPDPIDPPSSQVNPPSISFTLPADLIAGKEFSVPVQINFFSSAPYFIKVRIGPDENHLTRGQTFNGDTWLDDNDSWSKFPQVNGPNWQGNVSARLPEDEKEGKWKISVRVKKVEADSFVESNSQETYFNSAPTQVLPATKATPPPVISTAVSKTALAIETAGISKDQPDESQEASVDGKILGIGTSSGSSSTIRLPKITPKVAAVPTLENNLRINNLMISLGLFIVGFAGVWLIRTRSFVPRGE